MVIGRPGIWYPSSDLSRLTYHSEYLDILPVNLEPFLSEGALPCISMEFVNDLKMSCNPAVLGNSEDDRASHKRIDAKYDCRYVVTKR